MRSTTVLRTLLTFVGLVPLTSLRAADWVVAADGSAQFTDIQSAVDSAQSGDVIWVMPGSYGSIDIVQKAVSVIGAGADTTSVSAVVIDSVPPGMVVLSRLTISAKTSLTKSQGSVVLRDCEAQDLELSLCERVFLENWHGRRGSCDTVDSLWIAMSRFEGSAGKDAVPGAVPGSWLQLPTPGLTAFRARKSTLFATGSDFLGGNGGQGSCNLSIGFLVGTLGGAGLTDESGNCSFWIAKCTFTPGLSGSGGPLCKQLPGPAGLKTMPATKLSWDEAGASLYPLSILTPSVIGTKTQMKIWGQPDDGVMLLIATHPLEVLDTDVAGFPLAMDMTLGFVNFWPLTRTIGTDGTMDWIHKIPFDPLLVGTPVFVQAFLVAPPDAPPHPSMLTGVSSSIISD